MLGIVKKQIKSLRNKYYGLEKIRTEFSHLQFSQRTMQKLISDFEFNTVLDIGCGDGNHSEIFLNHGKTVTAIDYGDSVYFKKKQSRISSIIGDFNDYNFEQQFDCVWCSHVLEHQLNVNSFLKKVHSLIKHGGILAITVPPLKHEIVGGHVSFWNPGLLLYNLVLAGFDCQDAKILNLDYNISILVEKKGEVDLSEISFDSGDIRKLKRYFPSGLKFNSNENDDPFKGDLTILNW